MTVDSGPTKPSGFPVTARCCRRWKPFVGRSPRGFFANDLADALHVEVHDALRQLVQRGRLRRTEVAGLYLYTSIDPALHRQQLRMRQTAQSVPVVVDAGALQVSPDELKAAILLFYRLLDEQQRASVRGSWNRSDWAMAEILCWRIS